MAVVWKKVAYADELIPLVGASLELALETGAGLLTEAASKIVTDALLEPDHFPYQDSVGMLYSSGFAASDFAAVDHEHDLEYAALDHNHAGAYDPINSGHDEAVDHVAAHELAGVHATLTINGVPYSWPVNNGDAGQVLCTDGAGNLVWADQSGTGGTGLTLLNGLSAATQFFGNDANITISSGGATHTLTWAGLLAVARGGTGLATVAVDSYLKGNGTSALVPRTPTQVLGDIGASPVAGSSSIVTVGTIGAGAWNGTAIPLEKIAGSGTHTLTGAVEIAGAYNIDLSSYNMKFVAPSTTRNVISDAVTAMEDGDCIVLGAGSYWQRVSIAIPNTKTRFAIIGPGSAVCEINFEINDVDGIASDITSYLYAIHRCLLRGFTMKYNVNATSTKAGITLYGHEQDLGYGYPRIQLDDISIFRGDDYDKCWAKAIRIIDGHFAYLNSIHIRMNSNARTRDGICMESCMEAQITNSTIMCTRYGINLDQGDKALVTGSDGTPATGPHHGCEAVIIQNVEIYMTDIGVRLGDKAYQNKLNNVGIPRPKTAAVQETWSSYTITDTATSGTNVTLTIGAHNLSVDDWVHIHTTGTSYGDQLITAIGATTITFISGTASNGETGTVWGSVNYRGWNVINGIYVDIDSNFTGPSLIYVNSGGTVVKDGYMINAYPSGGASVYPAAHGIELDAASPARAGYNIVSGNTIRYTGGPAGTPHNGVEVNAIGCGIYNNSFSESSGEGNDIHIASARTGCIVTGNLYVTAAGIQDDGSSNDVAHNAAH